MICQYCINMTILRREITNAKIWPLRPLVSLQYIRYLKQNLERLWLAYNLTTRLRELAKTKSPAPEITKRTGNVCSIINNSAAYCSNSITFGTEFDHMTGDIYKRSRSKGHRSRSQHDATCQQWKPHKSATDRLTDFKRGENYSCVETTEEHVTHVHGH